MLARRHTLREASADGNIPSTLRAPRSRSDSDVVIPCSGNKIPPAGPRVANNPIQCCVSWWMCDTHADGTPDCHSADDHMIDSAPEPVCSPACSPEAREAYARFGAEAREAYARFGAAQARYREASARLDGDEEQALAELFAAQVEINRCGSAQR